MDLAKADEAKSPARLVFIISGTLLPLAMSALDQTMVAAALPAIREVFRTDWLVPWVVVAFLVTSAASIPLYGKLCDIHGRRLLLLMAIALFTAGSALCAMAPNLETLVAARAIQGLGGGGIVPLAQTILADLVPPTNRARLQSFTALTYAAGMAAGPVLGSLIVEEFSWRAIFLANLPLGIAAFLLAGVTLKALPRREERHVLDLVGATLLFSATVLSLLAIARYRLGEAGGSLLPLLAGLLWLGTVLRLRYAAIPIIPRELLADRVVSASMATAALAMGAFLMVATYAPLCLATTYGLPTDALGAHVFPLMLGMPLGGLALTLVAGQGRGYRLFALSGLLLALAAVAAIFLLEHALPPAIVAGIMAAFGFGLGAGVMLTTLLIQNAVPSRSMGSATATTNLLRTLVGALFTTLLGGTVMDGQTGIATLLVAASLPIGIALLLMVWIGDQPLRSTMPDSKVVRRTA